MPDTLLTLEQITKSFGGTEVLRGIDLHVNKGEFVTLLGSSGCGKTTTLRIIAGLESHDSGRVLLNGADVTNVEPNKRDVNTVFQNYALFPHMTVAQNIAYSLKLKKLKKDTIKKEVTDILSLVQLEGFEERMPQELSGGQRQRVAIARALVNKPHLLLLDEPLGALDLQLRRQMQLELKKLQKRLGITFIYITHDQEEALNMSDRIIVMQGGYFEQAGSPSEIYDKPQTSYVARFVGNANIMKGTVLDQSEETVSVNIENCPMSADAGIHHFKTGAAVTLAVRSEHIMLSPIQENTDGLQAIITEKSFAGGLLRIVLKLSDETEIIASRHGIDVDLQEGETVSVYWDSKNAVLVDVEVPGDDT